MIWTTGLSVITDVFVALVGLFPVVSPPEWLTSANGLVTTLVGYAAGMGAWLPMGLAVGVAATIVVVIGVALAIKLVRIALSYVTLGGGSAG